jgi:enoyl-CoA hydratase/carnithine racemase
VGEFVNLEVSDTKVGTIRIDRPKMNALNAQVAAELGEAIDEAGAGADVRAVVVWGGERIFAAGADINEMVGLDPVAMLSYIGAFQDVFSKLERLPHVTIAAINGYALGGGCELALACDLRVCGTDARLGQPEILLGVIPGAGGTQRLPRLVGVGRARELIYTGRFVNADEALAIGLVNEVAAPNDVYARAVARAEQFAAGPVLALAAAKEAIRMGVDMGLDSGLLLERHAFSALFATEDQHVGMESFVERGPGKATFVGR